MIFRAGFLVALTTPWGLSEHLFSQATQFLAWLIPFAGHFPLSSSILCLPFIVLAPWTNCSWDCLVCSFTPSTLRLVCWAAWVSTEVTIFSLFRPFLLPILVDSCDSDFSKHSWISRQCEQYLRRQPELEVFLAAEFPGFSVQNTKTRWVISCCSCTDDNVGVEAMVSYAHSGIPIS